MQSLQLVVFHRDPRAIERETKQRGYDDKVATAVFDHIIMRGIQLMSRYAKAHELKIMQDAVRRIDPAVGREIASIYCDSKACSTYALVLTSRPACTPKDVLRRVTEAVARAFEKAIMEVDGGHNGFTVAPQGSNGDSIHGDLDRAILVNPDWKEDVSDG